MSIRLGFIALAPAVGLLLAIAQPTQAPPSLGSAVPAQPDLRAVRYAAPQYTERFQIARGQGDVTVSAVVSSGGATREVRVTKSLNPAVDRSCEEAVGHFYFEPRASSIDEPVTFTFSFKLDAASRDRTYAACNPCPFTWVIHGWVPEVAPIS